MTNTTLNGTPTNRLMTNATRPKTARRTSRWPKADKVMYWSATAAPWGLAILLLAVSMPHLSIGFMTICRCGPLAGWLLAVAIDSAQVVAKLQLTMAKERAITDSAKWTSAGIIAATSLMSMAPNVLAFLAGATDHTGTVLAWVAGIMLPSLILALSYTGSCFALAKPRRQPKAKGKGHK